MRCGGFLPLLPLVLHHVAPAPFIRGPAMEKGAPWVGRPTSFIKFLRDQT